MATKEKNRTLYSHPFSKAYWRDAAAELKSTRTLVIAALLIALRVALKTVVIPLAPNLNINVAAPLINALGAMIFGPVVAAAAALVSDTLGCIIFPQGPYFFPCAFVEVAGSVLFALFFYRTKMRPTRVILARFCMDLFVNIILNSAVMFWYFQVFYQKSYVEMLLPAFAGYGAALGAGHEEQGHQSRQRQNEGQPAGLAVGVFHGNLLNRDWEYENIIAYN